MNQTIKKRPWRQNDRLTEIGHFGSSHNSVCLSVFDKNFDNSVLLDEEILLILERFSHCQTICRSVVLRPSGPNCRTLLKVERLDLDCGLVRYVTDLTAERIDLLDQLPFGLSAHSGIAGHLGNGLLVHGEKESFVAHSRRGQRRLTAGVPGAHHNDIEFLVVSQHRCFT